MPRIRNLFRVCAMLRSGTVSVLIGYDAVSVMFGDWMLCRGTLLFHVLVVFCRRVLLHGHLVLLVFGEGTEFRGEMLRVPVVCGPKTFCKTIFHANSLSEDPGADASPTRVIRSTAT
jgi:hypothetical protein